MIISSYISISYSTNRWPTIYVFVLLIAGLYLARPTASKSFEIGKIHTQSDPAGYYQYLPAFFIYDGMQSLPREAHGNLLQYGPEGKIYSKYTFGVAIMQAPFFLLNHSVMSVFGTAADGYSDSYQMSIAMAALTYMLLGLFMIFSLLKSWLPFYLNLLILLCIYFGTNLMHYTHAEPGMSHVYLFFLVALFFKLLDDFYRSNGWGNSLSLALVFSLIAFIRPSHLIFLLPLLLYGINALSISAIAERVKLIWNHKWKYLIIPIPFCFLFAIQIFVWQAILGTDTYWSYDNAEGFTNWNSPKIWSVLFHVHNGLFIYAPILFFGLIGLMIGSKSQSNARVYLLLLAVATYVFASWWAWWFGGAYGHRCYVDFLYLFSIGLGFFIQWLKSNSRLLEFAFLGAVPIFLYHSIGLTNSYWSPWDGPNWTWESYWSVVGSIF